MDNLPIRPLTDLDVAARRLRAALLRLAERYHREPLRFVAEARKLVAAAEPQLAEHIRAGQLLGFLQSARQTVKEAGVRPRAAEPHGDHFGRMGRGGMPAALASASAQAYPSAVLPNVVLGATWLHQRIPFEKHEFDQLDADARRVSITVARTVGEATVRKLRDHLTDAVAEGQTLPQFKRAAAAALDASALSSSQVETLYRTHVGRAQTAGLMRVLETPLVRDQFPYLLYSATHDSRTRPEHKMMESLGLNGTSVYRADDPIWDEFLPPWSWNSVVPETVIQGPVLFASKASYTGEVLKLVTSGGRTLTVTANHPVLTTRGFVRADQLREGEQLLNYRGPVNPLAVVKNVDQPPTRIDDVFNAFSRLSGGVAVKPVGLNLDAETERRYADVQIVAANRQLRNDLEARSRQRNNAVMLPVADLNLSLLSSLGTALEVFGREFLSAVGLPHFRQAGGDAFTDDPVPCRIGSAANLNVRRKKAGANGGTADAEVFRELEFRYPGQVARDKLVRIESQHYRGSVYDVQTTTGHMVADGIVVSNCRCAVTPIDKETAAEYGVAEAVDWVRTGFPPAVPSWVNHPPFNPPDGWVPTAKSLEVLGV